MNQTLATGTAGTTPLIGGVSAAIGNLGAGGNGIAQTTISSKRYHETFI